MFIRIIGSALTIIGLAFALWARFYLGSNWSAYITLELDHKLIRTGPYAIVRHPIYAGFMTALIGSVLNFGHMRSFIAAVMVILAWTYKSGLEETFMRDHFGIEYDQYCHDVKRFIPKVW
jgi:protein-S-isoprenylcysteine O-methyltransferase Ste14